MEGEAFDPVVVTFACNWCGYPAARLTGVQNIDYPSGIKIVRVMCTGRVDPAMIMKAFEYGADGVALVGCRMDECHFLEGNKKAKERVEAIKKILDYIGLDGGRLEAEWLAAAETKKFAKLTNDLVSKIKELGPNPIPRIGEMGEEEAVFDKDAIDDIISSTSAHDCVECGKCTSVCPVARFDEEFAPRRIVLRALEGVSDKLAEDKDIWSCITCEMCNAMCPYEVDYSEFIRRMRSEAVLLGGRHDSIIKECPQGGMLQSMMRIMAYTEKQNRLSWIPEDVRIQTTGDVFYFTGCLPHMDLVFRDRELDLTQTAVSAIKLLNHAGIEPVVSNNEVCCGHDLNWVGDEDSFELLMNKNIEAIKESGAKTVVFTCPEGLRTFDIDYRDILGDLDFEVMHISEFLLELADEGDIDLSSDNSGTVTLHESCRLGRHLGIYDPPRELLERAGIEIKEMENVRDKAICCGVSSFVACSESAQKMQLERIMEAKRTEAETLLTVCPKCRIHLSCAISKEIPCDRELVDIPIEDYTVYLARHLNL
ncbi:MAG: hydrogenase iron-sulfur subunit [Methanomassiliicoccales archaeon]|nr:hydrogenase iron-sulfur subunit [Methanomassiliicoccales archaeon]NYT15914.1 hydrogenase iron-sulfur subunit [Methanomassiliicoccales archaeon]